MCLGNSRCNFKVLRDRELHDINNMPTSIADASLGLFYHEPGISASGADVATLKRFIKY